MTEDILKKFIDAFLDDNLDMKNFKEHIILFSKFLSYTNQDYKYNSTYLTQYINDFIDVREWLKKKMYCYAKILMELDLLRYQYTLFLDQFHYSYYQIKEKDGKTEEERDTKYERIVKNKIARKEIEVKVTIALDNREYMICKIYDDFEEIEIPIPSKETQDSIVSILSAIDEKIDNNNAI